MGRPPSKAPLVTRASFSISGAVFDGQLVGRLSATNSANLSWALAGGGSDYFSIDQAGIITVNPAGVDALNQEMPDTTYALTATARNKWGTGSGAVLIYREAYMGTIIINPPTGGGGGGGIPAGVTLRPIDGGSTYYATGFNSIPFDKTTAYPATITWASGTVNYTNGFDDPHFFPLGGSQDLISTSGEATTWLDWGWNVNFLPNSNSSYTEMSNKGIAFVMDSVSLNVFQAAYGTTLPACCVVNSIADEPQVRDCWSVALSGDQVFQSGAPVAGGTGTITNIVQSGRPWLTIFSGAQKLADARLGILAGGTIDLPPLTQTYATPNASLRRPHDWIALDLYGISPSFNASTYGGIYPQQMSNAVVGDSGSTSLAALTIMEHRRGSHQGVFIDYLRNYCGSGNERPIIAIIQLGDAFVNVPYHIGATEHNWEAWSVITHGARGIIFFDRSNTFYAETAPAAAPAISGNGNCPQQGYLALSEVNANRAVTFTGTISGNTLTVSGVDTITSKQQIQAGMVITSGAGGPPYPVILAQQTMDTEATFNTTASIADGSNPGWVYMPTTSITAGSSSTIPVPSMLDTTGTSDNVANMSAPMIFGFRGTGTGNYFVGIPAGHNANGWKCYCPGMNGTYTVSGGSGTAVSMTAKQPNALDFGAPDLTVVPTGSFKDQAKKVGDRIRDLAPVINSQFAVGTLAGTNGYVLPTTSLIRYIFPYAVISGALAAVPKDQGVPIGTPGTPGAGTAFFKATGIDCCVHYYQGASYSSSSGETISAGFYIFATTAYPPDTIGPISCTFRTSDTTATSVTAIGEGRANIAVSGGNFTDTFDYAWTVHVYRVNH